MPTQRTGITPDERRRSQKKRQAILRATWNLFGRGGFAALTVDAIAAKAGVGKATIYRWWPNKTAVLMETLHEHLDIAIAFPDTGSARDDLRAQIAAVIDVFTTTRAGRAYIALVAESQHDPQLAQAFAETYIAGRRASAAEVIQRGIDRGELRTDLDIDVAIDALYGAVYYRVLVSHAPTSADYAEPILDLLYPAMVNPAAPRDT